MQDAVVVALKGLIAEVSSMDWDLGSSCVSLPVQQCGNVFSPAMNLNMRMKVKCFSTDLLKCKLLFGALTKDLIVEVSSPFNYSTAIFE